VPAASRRLLVVSHRPLDYGGGGSVRWSYLRRVLPALGWQVSVVTARANPTGNEASIEPRHASLARARARVMGTAGTVLRPLYRRAGLQPEAFPPSMAWAYSGRGPIRRAIERERPNVVWATCPPQAALFAAVGALARADARLPFVAELRDLWAGSPFFDAGGDLLARLESRAFARADAIVSVTDGCRERLLALHPEIEDRFELLPNGFDPALLARRRPPGRVDGSDGSRATLIHAGTLYGDRTVVALLRALARPELRERVALEIVGVVDERSAAAIHATGDGGPHVRVLPPTSWATAIDRTLAADIAVVINSPGTGGEMALPSKLFEALALGRPVLALTGRGSETERLLTRLGHGAGCAPPDDERAIARALTGLLDAPPAAVDPALMTTWDRSNVAQRIAALLDRLSA
jgi:glycosyltransferase involved in cell wall biosynthesis